MVLGPWWDACLTDFPQFYQQSLRAAWEQWPGVDFAQHVVRLLRIRSSALRRHVLGGYAEWGPDEENRALLLEVQHHQLDLDWQRHNTDEVEARRERMRAERARIRPPKHPIVPPVAARPQDVAADRLARFIAETEATNPAPVKELVSSDEFDQVIARM